MEKLHYFSRSNYGSISYYLVEDELRHLVQTLLNKRSQALTAQELNTLAQVVRYPDGMAELVQQADPELSISA